MSLRLENLAQPRHDGDVLLAAGLKCHRRSAEAAPDIDFPQRFEVSSEATNATESAADRRGEPNKLTTGAVMTDAPNITNIERPRRPARKMTER